MLTFFQTQVWMHTTSWIIFFKNLDINVVNIGFFIYNNRFIYFEEYKIGKVFTSEPNPNHSENDP